MAKKRKKTPKPSPVVAEASDAVVATQAAEPVAALAEPPVAAPEPAVVAAAEPESQPALTEEKAIAVLAETPEPAESSVAAAPESVLPETTRPKKKRVVKKKKRATSPPPVTRDALDHKINQLEAKLEVKKEEAAKAAREGFGSNPAIDDTSVPPVDLEIHDEFFAAGEKASAPVKEPSGPYSAVDARHAQKMTPQAHARRAHLARYVMWAVGGALGILVLGLTVRTFRGRPNDEPVRHVVAHVAAPVEQRVAAEPAPEKVAAPPAPVASEQAKAPEAPASAVAAADSAKPEGSAEQASTDVPKDMPAEKPKTAWQEKQAAKAALERGANGAAIAAGERSVALDATDAEAWLVLGAAYQASGNVGQAKRAFHSCVTRGRKGPVSDCRDMLSSL